MGWNDSRGIMSWDGTTLTLTLTLTQNDSHGVVLSQDLLTPLESLYSGTETLPWSRSIPGQNDSHGVVLSQDRMTTLESFYPRTD